MLTLHRLHDELAVRGIRKPTPETYNLMDPATAALHIESLLGNAGFVPTPAEQWDRSSVVWASAAQRLPHLPGELQQSASQS